MSVPVLFAIDEDERSLGAVERELIDRYSRSERLALRTRDGATETVAAEELFLMIGARPNTEWLAAACALGDGGFIRTGAELGSAGDVRHGSINRVASAASAVGEGSIAIKLVHELFAAEQLQLS